MTYQGGCHCGRIQFQVEGKIDTVMDCNCSLCRKRGGLIWFVPRSLLRLTTLETDLSTYRFNTKKLQHHFCLECGIAPFSEGTDPRTGNKMAAVNIRCLEGVEPSSLKIAPFDGRSM